MTRILIPPIVAGCTALTIAIMASQASPAKNIPTSTGRQVFIDHNNSMALPFRWGSSSHGLALAVALEKSSFAPGTPIRVWFAVRNVSGTTRAFFRLGDLSDYGISLRDSTGRTLEQIPGSAGMEFNGGLRPAISIASKETYIYEVFDLNHFFNLTCGRYSLTATSAIFQNFDKKQQKVVETTLTSGAMEFEVKK